MSYTVFTDSCSNIPNKFVEENDIHLLPCRYSMDGEEGVYLGDLDGFDFKVFYDKLRSGSMMKTSLLNTALFIDMFRPELEMGKDIIYVGLSSGVSGTFQAAKNAAEELGEEYPERTIRVVDSLGAGMGVGLLTLNACDLRNEGKTADEAADILDANVMKLLQFFTVDDLNFLKRTGRVSGVTAAVGTALSIKPLLWGDTTGHIVAKKKCLGRKKAIESVVEQYKTRAVDVENGRVAISHGDCEDEANELAQMVCDIAKPRELIIVPHEPFTGAHVGPGMLALFFFGESR